MKHVAAANTEFVAYVESDADATAGAFATRFSPDACRLFKLEALWGYASMARPSLPGEPDVFSSEVRRHARDVMPAELWQPMLEVTSARRDRASDLRRPQRDDRADHEASVDATLTAAANHALERRSSTRLTFEF